MERDKSDGRQTIVAIAPKGRTAYAQAAPVMARRRAAIRETFTEDEIKDLVGYLDRLEAFLRQPISEILNETAPNE